MVASNQKAVLDLIFGSEGGYTDHPADPGGPTNFGITLKTLAAWRKTSVTAADVKALTLDEAEKILGAEYLPAVRFDDLPSGLDYCVADFAVNSGPAQAVRTLQRLVGVGADGIMGTQTLAAIPADAAALSALIGQYCAARLAFMKSLSTWGTFGKGWEARVRSVESQAYTMATGSTFTRPATDYGEVQAKASPADVRVTATSGGMASIVAMVGAAGTAAASAAAQLQPFAGVELVRNIVIGLTVLAAATGIVVAVAAARKGAAT